MTQEVFQYGNSTQVVLLRFLLAGQKEGHCFLSGEVVCISILSFIERGVFTLHIGAHPLVMITLKFKQFMIFLLSFGVTVLKK